ncbi:MAG: AmmeMemoRadiSam system protein A [Spirochaetaceae bacterium]|nr:MAG: AmmeMemoRadiSam system protein A [Spirochaetaceae bacterium]
MERNSREYLVRRARAAIAAALRDQAVPDEAAPEEVRRTQCGLFVTLHHQPEADATPRLRGCIGHLQGRDRLDREIISVAQQAAYADPRFAPLASLEELDDVVIEVSLLSPFEALHDIETIEPGRDGLYITCGSRSGLLLPQVASDRGWDRLTFLRHLCIKAGCREECWSDPQAQLYRFQAEVFDEHSLGMR